MCVAKDLESLTIDATADQNPRIAIRSRVQHDSFFLELFSGCGQVSKCLRRLRLDSSEIEILKGNHFDVSTSSPIMNLTLY